MWPFTKRELRQDFTQSVVDRIVAQVTAGGDANVGATAAAAIASGIMSRSFASASVEPSRERTGLTPNVLADIGAAFVVAGESVWMIEVSRGAVSLIRASSWDVEGAGPVDWRYRLTLPGPSGSIERNVPDEAVLHPRINTLSSEPHRGRSPLALAGLSALALANAERQLNEELSGPVGRLIPAPLDTIGPEALDALEASLSTLKGRSALVPSMSREWTGTTGMGSGDWQSRRIGADPPDSVVKLRADGHNAVLAAAGVPPQLFAAGSQANASREALRQFLHVTVSPLARILEVEAAAKLSADVTLDFTALHASDVQGRARAFQSLVAGGMDITQAAAASGILTEQDE